MLTWEFYPTDYRAAEVRAVSEAVRAGECVSLVGLSGAGKSNLLGFIAHRVTLPAHRFLLADCNRLTEKTPSAIFRLLHQIVAPQAEPTSTNAFTALETALATYFQNSTEALSCLIDLSGLSWSETERDFFDNLRALRDAHKYQLTWVTATRRPLPAHTEFADLILANTLWLGPLSLNDAQWTVRRYAERKALLWDETLSLGLIEATRGYPSFLRAACEAYAAGIALADLTTHPAIQKRLEEFWSDQPSPEAMRLSGLADHPWLTLQHLQQSHALFAETQFTAKESRLVNYFLAHPEGVCEKDDLIQAVWPEDHILARGVRDDSLAQLVRRVREKIEADPAQPRIIVTVPGRGYRYGPPKQAL